MFPDRYCNNFHDLITVSKICEDCCGLGHNSSILFWRVEIKTSTLETEGSKSLYERFEGSYGINGCHAATKLAKTLHPVLSHRMPLFTASQASDQCSSPAFIVNGRKHLGGKAVTKWDSRRRGCALFFW